MRLILFDRGTEFREHFFPLTLSRPLWELRCGISSLGEKLQVKTGIADVAYFLPDYMAATYRTRTKCPVNETTALKGEDLLLVDARVKADTFEVPTTGTGEVGLNEQGEVLYARIPQADARRLSYDDFETFLGAAKSNLPHADRRLATWNYTWDLILANPGQLVADYAAAGKSGIEGTVEQPNAIRGSRKDVYVAPGVTVHPMVVIDAEHGPVYIDEGAEIHPFTRIEGPCYVGKKSILLGAKCREGNSIGPVCRIGGELEESIIQGYSNKYHDGFIGHSYVGEWVNLGALTTNSDLKNDYSTVSVMLDGKHAIDTGSTKVGALIGDHVKTSIGTLFNTGSCIGAMAIIMATGKPLPKTIPSFAWFVEGLVTKGFGRSTLYETAAMAMSRRGRRWTEAEQAMWDAIFEITAPMRKEAIQKSRRAMMAK
ncbi:MAG TPA: putative sugar nucleotidyl transferase [Sedimentisphaerales bacterium]|nr:putative sugar nucleotidyl transferase [Sedimentisphaerales bacterium]HRS11168.1 putative sugar nucleotidyl transferase [Sedimentisphaerales bacterium]HRV47746.1 putative sugar nucleotidyl transferase [Sedimentisphaerales bacterium]